MIGIKYLNIFRVADQFNVILNIKQYSNLKINNPNHSNFLKIIQSQNNYLLSNNNLFNNAQYYIWIICSKHIPTIGSK